MYVIKALTRGFEDWGEEVDDFHVVYQLDVGEENIPGASELFTFDVISPKRLQKSIRESEVEIGRGYFIMTDFNETLIYGTVKRLLNKCYSTDYDKTNLLLSKYFRWEMDE